MKKLLVLMVSILWCSTALFGTESSLSHELKGDQALSQGDYQKAYNHYFQALKATLEEGAKTKKDLTFARGSYFLYAITDLTQKYLHNYKDLAQKLRDLLTRPLSASLRASVRWSLLDMEVTLGRYSEGAKLSKALGFLQHFAILGAFDNERGGGFQTTYPPEKGIHLKGIYPGKKRKIHWRFTPVQSLYGEVNLDEMFLPNDQVLAYGLTYVYSPKVQAALFGLATDESYRLWLNDQLVGDRDVKRELTFDQDVYGVQLNKGWNKILIKATDQTDEWGFRLRLTDLQGEVIPGVRSVTTLQECLGIQYKKGFQKVSPPKSPIEILEKAAAEARDGRLYHYAAYLYNSLRPGDENAHKARKAWKQALLKEPKNALYNYYLSFVAGRVAEYTVGKEENNRRFALEKTIELNPQFTLAYFELARYYFSSLQNRKKGLHFINKTLDLNPQFLEGLLLRRSIYTNMGWSLEGEREMAKILKMGGSHPYLLAAGAAKLFGQNRLEEAKMTYLESRKAKFDFDESLKGLAKIYLRQNQPKEALKLINRWIQYFPYDKKMYRQIIQIYEGQDNLTAAKEYTQRLLDLNPDDDNLWIQMARYKMREGLKTKAMVDLETALQVNPNNAWLRKYLEFLKRDEKSFEDKYKEDIAKVVTRARKQKFSTDNTAHILLDKSVIKVYADGTSSEFTHFTAIITNEAGIREYTQYPIYFFAGEQNLKIKEAKIYRKDGAVEEARTGSGFGGGFSQWSNSGVTLPTLKVGDIIDIQYRVDGLRQGYFGNYFGTTFNFQSEKPISRSQFILIAPSERKLYFHTHKLNLKPRVIKNGDKTTTYIWEREDIPKLEPEPLMPGKQELVPYVQVSTFKDWQEFGVWYWHLVRKQMEMSDELRSKVQELTKGLKTPFEKVRAIYNFVVTDIRYSSEWEFGIHGYKPYSAAAIYARKFGDCKDKATLINTMLKEVGIDSYPVLIKGEDRRSKEDLSLPLVGHFNHCISYVPKQKGIDQGMFLDGTAEFHSVDTLPSMDWGATVVVVTPKGGEVHTIPYPKGRENQYRGQYKIALKENGEGEIQGSFEGDKSFGVLFRSLFQNKGRQKKNWERVWGKYFGGARVKSHEFSPLKDLNKPVKGKLELQIPKLLDKRGKKFFIPRIREPFLESKFGEKLTDMASKSERKFDVILTVPTSFDLTYEFELPQGFILKDLPGKKVIEHPFGYYLYEPKIEGNVLKIHKIFILKKHRITVKEYERFRKFCEEVEKQEDENIVLHPKEEVQ